MISIYYDVYYLLHLLVSHFLQLSVTLHNAIRQAHDGGVRRLACRRYVDLNPFLIDVIPQGRGVGRDCDRDPTTLPDFFDGLDDTFAKRLFAHQFRTFVLFERGGEDFRGTGGPFVDDDEKRLGHFYP